MTTEDLLQDALSRVFVEGVSDASLWARLDDAGFARVGVPEAAGGAGGAADALYVVAAAVGAAAAPVPLAETVAAGQLCARAGLVLPPGVATFGPARPEDRVRFEARGGRSLTVWAELERIPWGDAAATLVLSDGWRVAVVPRSATTVTAGRNIAGEPRDRVVIDRVVVGGEEAGEAAVTGADPLVIGSALRAAETVGALRRIVALTRDHVADRVQFGRPLIANQLVRDQLAVMVGEVAAADALARAALADGRFGSVAAARVRSARAAGAVAAAAHQLLGAVGFTDEHPLHRFSTRLWAWRDELGPAGWWEERLGLHVGAAGARLWPAIAGDVIS